MSLPSLDREGFFPRKDFMFIIKEQYSINLAPLKLRTSVCQEILKKKKVKRQVKLGEDTYNKKGL